MTLNVPNRYKVDVETIFDLDKSELFSLNSELNIYFVFSYPRSDMGKGNITAYLSSVLRDSSIMKYDGLLNTNTDFRHTRNEYEMDDFRIYQMINPGLDLNEHNHLLLGDLLRDFINDYGEYGHISFRPHFAKYFLNTIVERWKKIGLPNNLIIEVGGVITDYEVAPIIPYAINFFMNALTSSRIHLILLTECNYSGDSLKTKVIQDAVNQLNSKGLNPEYIFVRLPKELNEVKFNEDDTKEYISKKLENTCNFFTNKNKIGLIPYWDKSNLYKYNFLICKTMNIGKTNKIFIGTKNKAKISDWKRYFINLDIVDPYMLDKFIEVGETSESIFKNARNKAIEWSKLTNLITVSDDTGFFIPDVNNKPGVSVKTFGGELSEDRTDEEFIKHVYNRTKELKNNSCYFESAIAFAKSGKVIKEDKYRIKGELDFGFVDMNSISIIEEGYPLGMIFRPEGASEPWSFLSESEKLSYDSNMVETINRCVVELL